MRRHLALALATLVITGAACGGKAAATDGPPNVPSSAHPSASSTHDVDGTITGKFRIVGGPYPGIDRPLNGTIKIHAKSAQGHVVATVITTHGHYTAQVPPGRYVAVGKSRQLNFCTSGQPVQVVAGQVTHARVQCDVP